MLINVIIPWYLLLVFWFRKYISSPNIIFHVFKTLWKMKSEKMLKKSIFIQQYNLCFGNTKISNFFFWRYGETYSAAKLIGNLSFFEKTTNIGVSFKLTQGRYEFNFTLSFSNHNPFAFHCLMATIPENSGTHRDPKVWP